MTNFLIFGYLPFVFMRRFPLAPALTAACGQLMMVRAEDYARACGHAAVRHAMHDGLKLARRFRKCGLATDFVQAVDLGDCRMFDGARETWDGFSKTPPKAWRRRARCRYGQSCWRAESLRLRSRWSLGVAAPKGSL